MALIRLAATSVCALFAAQALAQAAIHRASAIAFPATVEQFTFHGIEDYERQQVGLGYGYHYRAANGVLATVYVFTGGMQAVPGNLDHPVMARWREQTVAEIIELGRRRNEPMRQVASETVSVQTPAGDVQVYFDSFVVDSLDLPRKTHSWLWSARGFLLKIRVSEASAELAFTPPTAFAEAIVRLAARPADWKRNVRLVLSPSVGSMESTEAMIWMAYAIGLTGWVDKNLLGQSSPTGRFVPTFEADVYARDGQVRFWRRIKEKEPQRESPYMESMLKVAGADFLREYVWHYHRRPEWPAPADLKMDAFKAWQAEHLQGHAARTGAGVAFEWGPPGRDAKK